MDRVAIVRFLLGLLYWCKGDPPDDAIANVAESFPPDWFSKLDDNKECFNLLGEGKRFYQYQKPGHRKDEELSANYLVQEVPTGTNKWHFRHSTDKVNGLCSMCCSMGLLRLPLFATSGGRGKPPGINAKPPFYVIPVGVSLAATLRLSWRQVSNLGTPAWEEPESQLPKAGQVPLLVGLTWLPRRVWLREPEEPEAKCISCGRKERLIRRCVFAGIGSTKTDGTGRIWRDPHVLYTVTAKGDAMSLHASDALGASDGAAGQWAKIMAGMVRDHEGVNPLREGIHGSLAEDSDVHAWVVGFSTVQNDKYLEAMEYCIPFPFSSDRLTESLGQIERWQKAGKRMEKRLARLRVEGPAAMATIRPDVEARVSAQAAELLAGPDDAWEQAVRGYHPMMAIMANSLSPGFTTAAVQRRRQIANVLPDVRQKVEPVKKTTNRKGGGK